MSEPPGHFLFDSSKTLSLFLINILIKSKTKINCFLGHLQLLITGVKLFFPVQKEMAFKCKQKTLLLYKITVVKCLLYLADIVGEFKIEMPKCKPNMRLSSYLRLAGPLSDRILSSF